MSVSEDQKTYYTLLTDVLRKYIKARFGFNAMEMTSTEIISRLQQEEDRKMIDELNELFMTADLVKFAKHNPLMNENDANLLNAIDFINDTKILTPRVLHPMIRRTKGADLERVSWDEALDFTASKMQAIIDEYGPNAVMTTGSSRGGGNEANYVMQKFTRACIGTHSVDNCART